MAEEIINWSAWVPIEKAGETPEGDMLLSGPVASAIEDFDGDILEKAGIWDGLALFDKLGGQVDWCHLWKKTHDPDVVIGSAVERKLVDGTPFLTTKLRKGLALAEKVFRYFKDGMKLGYSIDGTGVRDTKDPKRIVKTAITMVTLAPQTKGFDQYVIEGRCPAGLVAVAKALVFDEEDVAVGYWEPRNYTKALTTGDGIVQDGATGAQALRRQELDTKVSAATFGGSRRRRKPRKPRKYKVIDTLTKSLADLGLNNAEAAAQAIMRFRRGEYHGSL